MLAKIENAYLAILRVVILVAATIALVMAAIGIVAGGAYVFKWAGFTQSEKPAGGSLADFISEQRQAEASSSAPADDAPTAPAVLPDIAAAARNVHKYLSGRSQTTVEAWRSALQRSADEMGANSIAYVRSVKALTQDLLASTGKPLSEARTAQLLDWHAQHFKSDMARKAADDAAERAQFTVIAGVVAGAMVTFLLIVFIFIFVKIERNLRVPRPSAAQGQVRDLDEA